MVNEINKLIGNALASGESLLLPEIGTLKVFQSRAARRSGRNIEQPRKSVIFNVEQSGSSVADIIAQAAGTDVERANQIYAEWLGYVKDGETITIEGVGVLQDGKFTMTEEFDTVLNPQGAAPVAVKPKADTLLYCFAALCCLLALAVCAYIWLDSREETPACELVEQTVIIEEPAVEEVAMEPTVAAEPAAVADADGILYPVSGRSYVVLGVFRIKSNAFNEVEYARFISDLACKVYRYEGNTYMVVAYENDSRDKCKSYRRTIAGHFEDSWVYTMK